MALNYSPLNKPASRQLIDTATGEIKPEWDIYLRGLTDRLNGAVDILATDPGDVAGPDSSTSNNLAAFDGTTGKLLKDSGIASSTVLVDADIGTTVQAFDADTLKADTADTLTAGFDATTFDAGTFTTGTYTPDPADGNLQKAVNNGAHTLAPPASDCSIVIQYTNDSSAGAITTSGFTLVNGDDFTTTNGHDFMCFVIRNNGFSVLTIVALQ